MMYGNGWGFGGWLMMTVMMVAFWGVIIFGIVAAVRGFGGSRRDSDSQTASRASSAEHVLAERYARGEVNEDEYRQRLATLREIHGGR